MKNIFKGLLLFFITTLILIGCNQSETTTQNPIADDSTIIEVEEQSTEETVKQSIADFYNYYPDNKYIVSVDKVKEFLNSLFILDVRPRDSYVKGHLPNAINIPLKEIGKRFDEIPQNKQVLVVCTTGQSAAQTAGILNIGGKEAVSLSGGLNAWVQAGLPVED